MDIHLDVERNRVRHGEPQVDLLAGHGDWMQSVIQRNELPNSWCSLGDLSPTPADSAQGEGNKRFAVRAAGKDVYKEFRGQPIDGGREEFRFADAWKVA